MKHYTCDRQSCGKEIPLVEHEQIEIGGRRWDICRDPVCRETFNKMRAQATLAIEAHTQSVRKIMAELEVEFLGKDANGRKA